MAKHQSMCSLIDDSDSIESLSVRQILSDRCGLGSLRYQTRRNELSSNFSRTAGLVIASEDFDGTQNDYASRAITVPSNGILEGEPVTGGSSLGSMLSFFSSNVDNPPCLLAGQGDLRDKDAHELHQTPGLLSGDFSQDRRALRWRHIGEYSS